MVDPGFTSQPKLFSLTILGPQNYQGNKGHSEVNWFGGSPPLCWEIFHDSQQQKNCTQILHHTWEYQQETKQIKIKHNKDTSSIQTCSRYVTVIICSCLKKKEFIEWEAPTLPFTDWPTILALKALDAVKWPTSSDRYISRISPTDSKRLTWASSKTLSYGVWNLSRIWSFKTRTFNCPNVHQANMNSQNIKVTDASNWLVSAHSEFWLQKHKKYVHLCSNRRYHRVVRFFGNNHVTWAYDTSASWNKICGSQLNHQGLWFQIHYSSVHHSHRFNGKMIRGSLSWPGLTCYVGICFSTLHSTQAERYQKKHMIVETNVHCFTQPYP